MSLKSIKNIILILSGKGGVGKSSATTQLALSLCLAGKSVGILDIDLTGPSIPHFLGIEDETVTQAPGGWVPVRVHAEGQLPPKTSEAETGSPPQRIGALHAMSLAFLLSSRSTAIIWRGPKKTAMIRQFLTDVLWPELDYLLIDTPPGTSDEHISVVETLLKTLPSQSASFLPGSDLDLRPRLPSAILITTPQAISTADVRKELNFCAKTQLPVIGVVENMAGYVCPCCGEVTNLFSKGGGEVMAREFGVRFLGGVPVDRAWGDLVEGGERPVYESTTEEEGGEEVVVVGKGKKHTDELLVDKYRDCLLEPVFREITRQVVLAVESRDVVLVDANAAR